MSINTLINLIGNKYGRLTVVGMNPERRHGKVRWDCECSCGNRVTVYGRVLKGGTGKSCGCLARELSKKRCTKHKHYGTPTYVSWQNVVQRTTNSHHKDYARYGARGIYVDREWLDFRNFLTDMGERPAGTSIDRIDSTKGYYKGNCRWATSREQSLNRSNTVWLTDGERVMCQSDWAIELGLPKTSSLSGKTFGSLSLLPTTPVVNIPLSAPAVAITCP